MSRYGPALINQDKRSPSVARDYGRSTANTEWGSSTVRSAGSASTAITGTTATTAATATTATTAFDGTTLRDPMAANKQVLQRIRHNTHTNTDVVVSNFNQRNNEPDALSPRYSGGYNKDTDWKQQPR